MDSKNNLNNQVQEMTTRIILNADYLYKFVTKYSYVMHNAHDYGTGELISMVEVHLLTYIEENPGITVTKLSKSYNRTKSAISQQIKKLEEKKYIEKIKKEDNAKTTLLYATKTGKELSLAHKIYDISDISQTLQILLKTCSLEEVSSFYKVIEAYIDILDNSI